MPRSLSHFAAPPPGAFRTSRANPAHTKPIARVTTMSGTRVTITRPPLTAPSRRPRPRTSTTTRIANSVALALHHRRGHDARERHHRPDREVDAAADHDDRLGDGGERQGQDRRRQALERDGAVARLDALREQELDDQDREQRDDPGVVAQRGHEGGRRPGLGDVDRAGGGGHRASPSAGASAAGSTAGLGGAAVGARRPAPRPRPPPRSRRRSRPRPPCPRAARSRRGGCTPRAAARARRRPRPSARARCARRRSRSRDRRRARPP